MIELTQTEAKVSYSIGIKCNIGNYESADGHFSETETFAIESGHARVDIDEFTKARYESLVEKLDTRAEGFYAHHSKFGG